MTTVHARLAGPDWGLDAIRRLSCGVERCARIDPGSFSGAIFPLTPADAWRDRSGGNSVQNVGAEYTVFRVADMAAWENLAFAARVRYHVEYGPEIAPRPPKSGYTSRRDFRSVERVGWCGPHGEYAVYEIVFADGLICRSSRPGYHDATAVVAVTRGGAVVWRAPNDRFLAFLAGAGKRRARRAAKRLAGGAA